MKNLRLAQAGGLVLVTMLLGASPSFAQPLPPAAPLTITPTDPQAAPVPEWLVWKAFHRSLAFYNAQSPQAVQELLSARAGVQPAKSVSLLSSGAEYVQELERIDSDVKQQIYARYRSDRAPPVKLQRPAFRSGGPTITAATAIAQPSGGSILEQARKDGFYAEVEKRKAAALAAHKKSMAASLTSTQLAAIQRFVETEVAPHVKVFSGPGELVNAPDRSTQGRVVLQPSAGK